MCKHGTTIDSIAPCKYCQSEAEGEAEYTHLVESIAQTIQQRQPISKYQVRAVLDEYFVMVHGMPESMRTI